MGLAVLALALSVGIAECSDLGELRATQQKLIAARDSNKLPRDEVPLDSVALAKRQLLAWAESRLQSFGGDANPADLTKIFGQELQEATKRASRDDPDLLGDFAIAFSRPKGEPSWVQMSTDVGIPCGFDRSVYLYEWGRNRWNRRFALETDDYRKSEYGPQDSVELQVSARDARGARLALVTGWPPACISVWHTLYIRLFRIAASQRLLLEETPLANLDPPYSARLEPSGALIEFAGSSIDAGFLVRKHVLHYTLDDDSVRRIEPIALSPRDFVDEWLTRPWTETRAWSEPQLAKWHSILHKDNVQGDFEAVQRCKKPNEWQISTNLDGKTSFFSLLDEGQNRFRMVGISAGPRADCSAPNELPK